MFVLSYLFPFLLLMQKQPFCIALILCSNRSVQNST